MSSSNTIVTEMTLIKLNGSHNQSVSGRGAGGEEGRGEAFEGRAGKVEERVRGLHTAHGVTGGCEPSDVGAENQIQVLCRSSTYS